jgi:hypothetical protein
MKREIHYLDPQLNKMLIMEISTWRVSLRVLILLIMTLLHSQNSNACLEPARELKLVNSPFPFSKFSINSRSFIYNTPDGMQNTIICDPNKDSSKMEWHAIVVANRRTVGEYSNEDLINAKQVSVYDKEVPPPSTLALGNTDNFGYAVLRKPGSSSQAQIQLNCSIDSNGIQTMATTLFNNKGDKVAEFKSMHNTRTRSLEAETAETNTIDFNSSSSRTANFIGCGVNNNSQGGQDVVQ